MVTPLAKMAQEPQAGMEAELRVEAAQSQQWRVSGLTRPAMGVGLRIVALLLAMMSQSQDLGPGRQ